MVRQRSPESRIDPFAQSYLKSGAWPNGLKSFMANDT